MTVRQLPPIERDRGASLIEMVVALAIFAIVSAALLSLLLTSARLVRGAKQRALAAQVAASAIDEARAQGAVAVTPGRTTSERTVGGIRFTVTRDAQFVARGATDSSCTSPGIPSFLRVRVSVSWPTMGTVRAPEANTLITPGVGDVDQATGMVAVTVVDRTGAPVANLPVTLNPGTAPATGPVQRTTAEGCAFFAFVAPGSYTAWLGSPGWVDQGGQATPSVTTSVTASRTATVSLQYDRAAALEVVGYTDPGHPAPTDLPVTLYATVFGNDTKTKVIEPTGASPLLATGLFPTAAGYTGWAGRCLANDPGESLRPQPAATEPGSTGSLTVPLARFEVRPQFGTPPAGGYQVTAQQAPDAGCPDGAAHTWVSPANGAVGGALPFGEWTFTVTDGTRTTTTPPVLLDPAGNGVTTVQVDVP